MKFEVINSNGRCMQTTNHPECVPYQFLESMANHGYKFRVDGKIVSRVRVKTAIEESLGIKEIAVTPEVAEKEIATVTETVQQTVASSDEETSPIQKKKRVRGKIVCVEDGKEFNSQSDAAEFYNISPMSISNSVKNGKAVKGHTFKKVD